MRGSLKQRAGDGDPLLQTQRQSAHEGIGIDRLAGQLLHQLGGPGHLAVLRQGLREERVRAHEDIVDHGTFIGHQNLLVDGGNSEGAALGGGRGGFAEDRDRSAESMGRTPEITLAMVLLPHPLPPTIAWISPARAEKLAPSSARVGPKYFFTLRTMIVSRSGAAGGAETSG